MILKKKYLMLLIMLVTSSFTFAEKLNLEAYASGFDSIPVAVLRFRSLDGDGLTNNEPWKIIARDLEFYGKFKVIKCTTVDSELFAKENVGIFIDGEYKRDGNSVILDCFLHDATTLDQLAGKKYKGNIKFLRSMSHKFSNEIVDMLLGEKGYFNSKILYVRDLGIKKNLEIMDYDGKSQKTLTTKNTTVNVFPTFLDSSNIIWTSFRRGKPDLYKASMVTGKQSVFIYSRFVETSPCVSDIVGKIAYGSSKNGNLDIYICDLNGKNRKQLTFNRAIDTSPSWSPNGYQIAFTSDRVGNPQIYVMDVDGVNTKRLTFQGKYQDSPAWSPNGDKIAYASYQNGKFDIWTIDPDGSNAEKITDIPGNNEYPTWSPDGSYIAFASTRGGKSDIYAIRKDGTNLVRITNLGNVKMPDWSRF